MRLAIKGSLTFLALYSLVVAGVAVWLEFQLRSWANTQINDTARLIGSEMAKIISGSALNELMTADASTRQRLEQVVDEVTEHSAVVGSVAVVDGNGRVVASDQIPAGQQLAIPQAIFRADERPRATEVRFEGGDYHLLVPLVGESGIIGYLRLAVKSQRIAKLYYQTRRQFLLAAVAGLLSVGVFGLVLHGQLTGQGNKVVRALEEAARGGAVGVGNGGNEFARAIEVARTIGSELSAAREERLQANQRLGALTKAMNVGVLLLDADGKLDFASPTARELLGSAGAGELEARWQEVAVKLREAVDRRGLQAGRALTGSVDVDWSNAGEHRQLRCQIYRINEDDGTGFLVLVKDRAMIDALEQELGLAIQMRGLARFYEAFAHDLKAPLNAMVLNLELLKRTFKEQDGGAPSSADDGISARQLRYAETLRQELSRLDRQLRTLLSHVASPSDTLQRIDLRDLILDLATLLAPQAERQHVGITTQVPGVAVQLTAHGDRLKQAMLNLAINALEAMPSGGHLAFDLTVADDRARITVRDDGPGIPPELLDRIYEMHFSTKSGGTGVGLYVARSVVESHGGSIQVESELARGTCFRIEMPLDRAQAG